MALTCGGDPIGLRRNPFDRAGRFHGAAEAQRES